MDFTMHGEIQPAEDDRVVSVENQEEHEEEQNVDADCPKFVLSKLLPSLKHLADESTQELHIENARHNLRQRILCDLCGDSIIDWYRKCPNCSYRLCCGCCKSIREGNQASTSTSVWRADNDHNIFCPRDCGILKLEILPVMAISSTLKLIEETEDVMKKHRISSDTVEGCACEARLFHEDMNHFQLHWSRAEPVVVSNAVYTTLRLSWDPRVIYGDSQISQKLKATQYWDLCEVEVSANQFFTGYEDGGYLDDNGQPKMLKLNDWPPSKTFCERCPQHYAEFTNCLPFKEYTHPQNGPLNLAIRLPEGPELVKPDLGPKIFIAYGNYEELGHGDSVTKLQIKMSDVVSILMHTTGATSSTNDPDAELDGGAVWDIFRREDVLKLQQYLQEQFEDFRHLYCNPVSKLHHPLLDQAFYLNTENKERLKEDCGIEARTFIQKLGDAVFIPAGCPYQVRNLKSCVNVEMDFFSPESMAECIRLTKEISALPMNYRPEEGILEVKKMCICGVQWAVEALRNQEICALAEGQNLQGGDGGSSAYCVLIICLTASIGGLMCGYNKDIIGGVISKISYLNTPTAQSRDILGESKNIYCAFNDFILSIIINGLDLTASITSLIAAPITSLFGRKVSILIGSLAFITGAFLSTGAFDLAMLIVGRVVLGIGLGFAKQAIPIYISEMAPKNCRGALAIGFQMAIFLGSLAASVVDYGTSDIDEENGWRTAMSLGAVPVILSLVGYSFIPETPTFVCQRGNTAKGRNILQKIRGTVDVDKELQEIVVSVESDKEMRRSRRSILKQRYLPPLIICVLIPLFQQLAAVHLNYIPLLFQAVGVGDSAFFAAVAVGIISIIAAIISIFVVDRYGRRVLFLLGGCMMVLCQIPISIIFAIKFGNSGVGEFSRAEGISILVLSCLYAFAYSFSWAVLGDLLTSEVCPLEIRSIGQGIGGSISMLAPFIISLLSQPILCKMKYGLFILITGFDFIMTIFIYFFLPETKNVPIEEMNRVWSAHWFWRKYIPDGDAVGQSNEV